MAAVRPGADRPAWHSRWPVLAGLILVAAGCFGLVAYIGGSSNSCSIGPNASHPACSYVGGQLAGANMQGAILQSSNFTKADLSGANLSGANLSGAAFANADLSGANLTDANLTDANLTDAALGGANLTGANLTGAAISGATSGAIVGTPQTLPPPWRLYKGLLIGPASNLRDADLENATLLVADLAGADLRGAHLSGADLDGADLTGADLTGADLANTQLTQGTLSQATLSGANLSGAALPGIVSGHVHGTPSSLPAGYQLVNGYVVGPNAFLADADLQGAALAYATLTNVDLSHANLSDADLQAADLNGANLKGVSLQGTNFEQRQLDGNGLRWRHRHACGASHRLAAERWDAPTGPVAPGAQFAPSGESVHLSRCPSDSQRLRAVAVQQDRREVHVRIAIRQEPKWRDGQCCDVHEVTVGRTDPVGALSTWATGQDVAAVG